MAQPSTAAAALHDAVRRPDASLIVRGVLLADGTGAPPRPADVLVRDGRIAAVTAPDTTGDPAATARAGTIVLDARALVLTPGFVDIHTHSDLTLLSDPVGRSKLLQGVTCEVIGNCGLGMAPLGATPAPALRGVNSYLDRDPAVATVFPALADHLDALDAAGPALHVASLAAHIPLHAAVCGLGDAPASPRDIAAIADLARAAVADGAWGLSTGLVYPPLCFVREDELLALGGVAAETGTVFAWHVRDYLDDLSPSVEQALRVAERTGCRTQISHLQAVGRRNWPALDGVLARIDTLRAQGVDVGFDIYPYLAGNAPLSQLLPSWAQVGGDAPMRARLADPEARRRAHAEMTAGPGPAVGPDEITVMGTGDPRVDDRTLTRIGEEAGTDGMRAAIDLVAVHGTGVQMVAFGRSPALLARVLAHPACVVASDGLAIDPDGPTGAASTHPRSYGTFPRYLRGVLDRTADPAGGEPGASDPASPLATHLGEAVRRCTSAPAARLGLPDAGTVAVGARADLVLLDPDRLADRATYADPHRSPDGILAVLVAGRPAAIQGEPTGVRAGRVLRRPPSDPSDLTRPSIPTHPTDPAHPTAPEEPPA